MAMTRLIVLPVPDALRPVLNYEARIFVGSDVALRPTATAAAKLGDQAVDGFHVQSLGESLSGYLKQMPQVGDPLRVALDSTELVDTGLTYQEPDGGPAIA
ncbi:MAG TPA: hypothetical protein VFL16_03930 [Steroidobacteraceae bacterium]|jgi:hypothetical protein|nr:hypothetical protein [Steroidobacteraceae bacterium]